MALGGVGDSGGLTGWLGGGWMVRCNTSGGFRGRRWELDVVSHGGCRARYLVGGCKPRGVGVVANIPEP